MCLNVIVIRCQISLNINGSWEICRGLYFDYVARSSATDMSMAYDYANYSDPGMVLPFIVWI